VGAIQKVAGNVYMVPGAGGNTAAFVTANGVVLVDTKLANNGQAILDQVKTVSDKPITHIINTHTHGDHNGSNQFFPASVEIVVQENTAKNMQKMPAFQEAANKHGLPDRTYKDRLTLLRGDEAIDLFYFGRAHTDGDTFVLFRNARVLHTGDAFANRGQPNIDLANGGSGIAYPDTLAKAASTIKNVDTIIAGHNAALLKHEDLVNQAEFTRLMLTKAREAVKAGKTPEEAMKEFQGTLPAKFKDYNLAPGRGGPGGAFVPLFEELKQGK
jgi:glyoxylase-like metal-dependent hydrolase (beta-lactamase superfamily II)